MKKLVLGVVVLVLLFGTTLSQQAIAEPVSPSAPQGMGITIGLYHPPTFNYGTELNAVNTLTGKKHGVVLYYVDWSTAFDPFLQNQINSQMAAGDRPIIMLAWGPARGQLSLGCDQNYPAAVPWDKITQGFCDTYITNYANAMKARSERFLIKFAHEMNGGGTPWSPINVGVNPSGFVAAWQHVRGIFSTQGVTNVEWVWGPIYQSNPVTAANDIHLYYPGDSYVDWVALSGYNYYTYFSPPQPWLPFTNIYDAGLKDFACRYRKPQIIHEMASVEGDASSPSKATWIADAYLKAASYQFLRAVVWYNDLDFANPSADFRITTSTQSQNPATPTNVNQLPPATGAWTTAYSNAVSSLVFTKTLQSLTAATPSSTICSTIYLPIIIK